MCTFVEHCGERRRVALLQTRAGALRARAHFDLDPRLTPGATFYCALRALKHRGPRCSSKPIYARIERLADMSATRALSARRPGHWLFVDRRPGIPALTCRAMNCRPFGLQPAKRATERSPGGAGPPFQIKPILRLPRPCRSRFSSDRVGIF